MVIDIVRKLRDAGFETWCVGGAVRDALLGIRNQDWDIATAAEPATVRRMFSRVIPLGVEFGTVGVVDRFDVMHEVTTFRRDVRHDGRHAIVEFGASFVEDLKRRDFTINAIAFDPIEQRLFDPFDGQLDLRAGVVRAVGVPIERFVEDRLRVLRGIRFAARFDFVIEPITWEAMSASGPHLGRLSAERVKQELDKTLEQVERPSVAFKLWQQCGAFVTLIPALANVSESVLRSVDAQPRPTTCMSVPRRQLRRQLRTATLFSARPAREVIAAMKALRASNAETTFVAALVEKWQLLEAEMSRELVAPHPPADAQLRRWAAAVGRVRVREFMRVAWARWAGVRAQDAYLAAAPTAIQKNGNNGHQHIAPSASAVRSVYRRLVHVAQHDAIEIADLAVDGDDLRAIGVTTGSHFGLILARLLDIVVEKPALNTRDILVEEARRLLAEFKDRRPPPPGTN